MDANTLAMLKGASDTSFIGDAVSKGMDLAKQAQQIEQSKQQAELQKTQIQEAQFNGSMGVLGTFAKMSSAMKSKFRGTVDNQLQNYKFNNAAPILDLMSSDEAMNAQVQSIAEDKEFLKATGLNMSSLDSQIAANPLGAQDAINSFSQQRAEYYKNKGKQNFEMQKTNALIGGRKEVAATKAETTKSDKDRKFDLQEDRYVDTVFNRPAVTKQMVRLTAAGQAKELLNEIGDGRLVDSNNVSTQLTNMINSIENAGGGSAEERRAMGVDTAYTTLKKGLTYISGKPESSIPPEYLKQLNTEVDALGKRAKQGYSALLNSAYAGVNDESRKAKIKARLDSAMGAFEAHDAGHGTAPTQQAPAAKAPAPDKPDPEARNNFIKAAKEAGHDDAVIEAALKARGM